MEKIILGSFAFLIVFQASNGFRYGGSELSSKERINDFEGLRNLCKCTNHECACCITIFRKLKACSSMGLIEERSPEGRQTFSIEIKVKINNKNVFSKRMPLTNIPPLCYGMFGVKVCAKITFRREMEDIKMCGSLQLVIIQNVLHEYDLYCIKIPFHKPKSKTSIPLVGEELSFSIRKEIDSPFPLKMKKIEDTFTISKDSPFLTEYAKLWKAYYLPQPKNEVEENIFIT